MKYILQFLTFFRRGTINPRASSSFSKEIDNSNLCEIDKIKVIFLFFQFRFEHPYSYPFGFNPSSAVLYL